jgi:hypothetical protein
MAPAEIREPQGMAAASRSDGSNERSEPIPLYIVVYNRC